MSFRLLESYLITIQQSSHSIQDAFLRELDLEPISHRVRTGTRYLYFGRLLELKKIDLLIEAFTRVANSEDTLSIIGDGPMLEKLTKARNLSKANNAIKRLISERGESNALSMADDVVNNYRKLVKDQHVSFFNFLFVVSL